MFGLTQQRTLLRSWLSAKMQSYLDKRQPAAGQLRLRQNILFVFPTRYGFSFLLLAVLLYLLGTNYQNNLILLQSYFIIGLLLLAVLLSFSNLYGLELTTSDAPAVFAGEDICIRLHLQHHTERQQLELQVADQHFFYPTLTSQLEFSLKTVQRGYHRIPRFKLSSVYPFGLIRCWSYPALAQHYWVYPTPRCPEIHLQASHAEGELQWSHLSPYQPGDPLQRIDWKRLARQPQQAVVKVFSQTSHDHPQQLVIPSFHGAALEQALSELCFQIRWLSQQQQPYSLLLPSGVILQDQGSTQQRQCLEALSLC